jgi:hypothetical protein
LSPNVVRATGVLAMEIYLFELNEVPVAGKVGRSIWSLCS